jgi:hypothetical protein
MRRPAAVGIQEELVNEEHRDYPGFAEILSAFRTAAADSADEPEPAGSVALEVIRAALIPITEEDRAIRAALMDATIAQPELVRLLQRLQDEAEQRGSEVIHALLASSDTATSEQE